MHFFEQLRILAIRMLTRRIARLNMRKTRGAVERLGHEAYLRVRALLLTLNRSPTQQDWPTRRRLVLLLDPVAAGLWPHLVGAKH
jgi:hypothetical protein